VCFTSCVQRARLSGRRAAIQLAPTYFHHTVVRSAPTASITAEILRAPPQARTDQQQCCLGWVCARPRVLARDGRDMACFPGAGRRRRWGGSWSHRLHFTHSQCAGNAHHAPQPRLQCQALSRVFARVLDVYLPIRKRRSSSAGVREHTAGCAGATPCTSADSTHSSFSTRSLPHRRGSLCGMGSAGVGSHLAGRVQEPPAILPAASFRLRPSTAGFAPRPHT